MIGPSVAIGALLQDVDVRGSHGLGDLWGVSGVVADSRRVGPGDAFVAVRGERSDGHRFLDAAVAAGASLLVVEEPPTSETTPWVLVSDARRALGRLSANLHGRPTTSMDVVGITGTNGKTTSAHIADHALQACGRVTGLLGTVRRRWPGVDEATEMTTPDAVELQALFARMLRAGVTTPIMEVSSHAIEQQRMEGVDVSVAAFTNLTQDHLDYHGTMDAYGEAKARLFMDLLQRSPRARGAAINVDDPFGAGLAQRVPGAVLRFSARGASGADLVAEDARADLSGLRATVRAGGAKAELRSALVGWHNLENLLTAIACGLLLGEPLDTLVAGAGDVTGVSGRLEAVPAPGFAVLVDYAHTPDALERAIGAVRAVTPGRVITVFGCGGDRDRGKRPLMGMAAAKGSDVVIVTSDNPRTEDPDSIVAQVVAGVEQAGMPRLVGGRGFAAMVDRADAIRAAIGLAEEGDTVLVAGKGHEATQDIGGRKVPFSDVVTARDAIGRKAGEV